VSGRLRVVLVAGIFAAATFRVVSSYVNGWPHHGSAVPVIYVITPTAVLVSYLIVGLIAWQHHLGDRIGPLFTMIGYALLLASFSNLHYALPFAIGNTTMSFYQAVVAHLALAWPYGRLRSGRDRVVVVVVYAWTIGNSVVEQLFWNPRTYGCGPTCPANLLLVDGSNRIENDIVGAFGVIGSGLAVAVVVLIAQHWWSARGYVREAMTRLVWVAAPIGAYIAVVQVSDAFNLSVSNLILYGIAPLILMLAPAAYAAGMFRARRARAAVGAALVDLEPGPPPGRLLQALAAALGDPNLQLAFRTADHTGYLDTGNKRIDAARIPPGRVLTRLDPAGDAVLVHDEELRHEPELVRVTAAVASLALEHSRLQAEIASQLEQVRASRTRLVEAGDEARRRLERDLHDGAQQRLVTLSLALAMASRRAAGVDPDLESLLESATKEAREALVELRELARGIHPAVLTEVGLAGAVQALVERTPVATRIVEVPAGRFPAPIEATAYFVVSEALANVAKHAPTATGLVAIRHQPGRIVVVVTDDGDGGARPEAGSGLRGLADRVASVGGALRVDSPVGRGTWLEADIPCP
jgi:signal transduction histidine kinase